MMLDPSSSEEESDHESVQLQHVAVPTRRFIEDDTISHGSNLYSHTCSLDQQSLSAVSRISGGSADNLSLAGTASGGSSSQLMHHMSGASSVAGRSSSPSPSLVSSDRGDTASVIWRDSEVDKSEREEEERRRRLQLYVFVIRCIAYPFNAKQPTDMVRRQAKVSRQMLQSLKERFQVIISYFHAPLVVFIDKMSFIMPVYCSAFETSGASSFKYWSDGTDAN
jgi:calcium-dependent secretion activator